MLAGLSSITRELILEFDTCWAQEALELVGADREGQRYRGDWIPDGCVKSVNWINLTSPGVGERMLA